MIGQRESCTVCLETTIRQCTVCQRWVCNRCRGRCPCLLRYLAIGPDDYRVAHVLPPDADIKAGLPCGTKALFNVRLDTAPEAGAKRCAVCFTDDAPTQADGWGARQATVAVPTVLYADLQASAKASRTRQAGASKRARHKAGADATAQDYIETETHKLTPAQVLLLDAAIGLPIAEEALARLVEDAASALVQVRSYENQAAELRPFETKHRQFCQAQARQWFEHRACLLDKLAEWQAVHTNALTTLLTIATGEAV